jgi:hypothetical protein
VKSRGKDDASISGIRDRRPSKCERRLSHLDIELLRSCGMRVSSGRVAEVEKTNPYEAVKSNPTPAPSSRMNVPSSDHHSRPDFVSEYSVETDKNKKTIKVAKTVRRRQQCRDVALWPPIASFWLRQQGQGEDSFSFPSRGEI